MGQLHEPEVSAVVAVSEVSVVAVPDVSVVAVPEVSVVAVPEVSVEAGSDWLTTRVIKVMVKIRNFSLIILRRKSEIRVNT